MSGSRTAHPVLHLARVQVPWLELKGKLMLAAPRRIRNSKSDVQSREEWVFEALMGLKSKAEFHQTCLSQGFWTLGGMSSRNSGSPETIFSWSGWDHLVLPFSAPQEGEASQAGSEWSRLLQGVAQPDLNIHFLPPSPPKGAESWPHEVWWTIKQVQQALQAGKNVLYLDQDCWSTSAFLPSAMALLGDSMLHPHKAVYGLVHGGLGMTPFQYGILVGMECDRATARMVDE